VSPKPTVSSPVDIGAFEPTEEEPAAEALD
jgi:hypothetical protein